MGVFVRAQKRSVIRRGLELDCQVVREWDFRPVGRRAVDLSTDGMQILSEADVSLGDDLIVAFRATTFGIYFETEATIARIIAGRRDGDAGRSLGLKFRAFDPVARHILRGALRKVPPPLPRRDPRIDYAATIGRIARAPAMDAFFFHD